MTRVVQRKRPKYQVQCEKEPQAVSAPCGYCIGPIGSILLHAQCTGPTSRTLTCSCEVCYGPPIATTTKETQES